MDTIPPTKEALRQHPHRASYQAGYVCGQALLMCPDLPSPEEWGWSLSETGFSPYWTALPEASLAIRYLIKCVCDPDLGCVGRCKCKCAGNCER